MTPWEISTHLKAVRQHSIILGLVILGFVEGIILHLRSGRLPLSPCSASDVQKM